MKKKKLTTQKMVTAGMLGAICIVLGVTGLGMIPVPSITGRATIMHVPVILAGILEGPLVGALTGLIFGLYSFFTPSGAIPADPIVRILPRVLIGIVSAYTFKVFRKKSLSFAAISAGLIGTITNTVGFVGLAILMGYLPLALILTIIPQFIAELLLASFVVLVLTKALADRLYR